ncbi:hypothetical protein GCM10010521_62920 [Streptomyces rameus]|uniref:Uncharacterized protein n=1 Tax=Streptomyces rameus TaxID=68261 RepID=A0ABN3V390_9ACTN
MSDLTRHDISEQRMDEALDDITGRVRRRWHRLLHDGASSQELREMATELLDHVAARTVRARALDDASRLALRTAAECALGALSIGCFPDGDQEVALPLIGERLSSEDTTFGGGVDLAPASRTWLDAFALCLVSGLVWDWQRVIGLLLRDDYAPAVHDGRPHSKPTPASDPADTATMDALCGYLTRAAGHLPRDWPTVPLCKPDADERAEAARRLDAAGPLAPDQQLLRVLLDDDRTAFEQALTAHLVAHRQNAGPDPAPASLLPLGSLAIAALAVQVHGWQLGVRSGYLPQELLGSPQAVQQAEAIGVSDLGYWAAK